MGIVLAVVVVLVVVLVALRRVDGNRYAACVLTLIPHAAVVCVVAGIVALGLGWWLVGGLVLAVGLVLGADVVPRILRSGGAVAGGRGLRVMSSNLYLGRGDVKTVVELVRIQRVDVLGLLELTDEAAEEFVRAGLSHLLPYHVVRSAPGGAGSALYSRYPLTELDLIGQSRLAQPGGRIDFGGVAVEVIAVHPVPPTMSVADWRTDLSRLPEAASDGPVRILAGDFNATADHAAFRRLLRSGYLDAARESGRALTPTWRLGPLLLAPLDHVLVDGRAGIASFRVFDIPGSDHRAVCAELVLPGPA